MKNITKIVLPAIVLALFLTGVLTVGAQTTTCLNLTHNFGLGATDNRTGGEVSLLQGYLISKGFMNPPSTGFFGPITRSALAAFQASVGISPANGYLGPVTRAYINSHSCTIDGYPNINTAEQNVVLVQTPDSTYGEFTWYFNVTAMGGDIWIPLDRATRGTGDGVNYNILDSNGQIISTGNAADSFGTESNASTTIEQQHVHLHNGETRRFSLNVQYVPVNSGNYKMRLDALSYSKTGPNPPYYYSNAALTTYSLFIPGSPNTGAPHIDSISPNQGTWGTEVTITGSGFNSPDTSQVDSTRLIFRRNGQATLEISGGLNISKDGTSIKHILTGPEVANSDEGPYELIVSNSRGQSNGMYFTIYHCPTSSTCQPPPTFTVTYPTEKSNLQKGQTYQITWSGRDPGVNSYSVYLVGGPLGPTGSVSLGTVNTSTQKSFSWTVPNSVQVGSGYQIQFSGAYASGDNSPSFNIVSSSSAQPSITVVSPNGGETLSQAAYYQIRWSTQNVPSEQEITLGARNLDSGLDYPIGNVISSGGTFNWLVGLLPGSYKLFAKTNVNGTIINDWSDQPFTITTGGAPSITVLTPNGGENWTVGGYKRIDWKFSPLPPSQFAIKLDAPDGSGGYTGIGYLMNCGIGQVYQDNDPSDHFWFNWHVGYDANGNLLNLSSVNPGYVVYVIDCHNNVSDRSNSLFTITSSTPEPSSLRVYLDPTSPSSQTFSTPQSNVTLAIIDLKANQRPVNNLNNIQIGSDSPNAANLLSNIKVFSGSTLLGTASNLVYNGSYYYQWIPVSGVNIPANGTIRLKLTADITSNAMSSVRLGIPGLNFNPPGAQVTGIPIYGASMTLVPSGGSTNHPPEITSSNVPTPLVEAQMYTFSWSARDIDKDDLSWSINWGDGTSVGSTCGLPHGRNGAYWNFSTTHAYAGPGTYNILATVSDCNPTNNTDHDSTNVTVTARPDGSAACTTKSCNSISDVFKAIDAVLARQSAVGQTADVSNALDWLWGNVNELILGHR